MSCFIFNWLIYYSSIITSRGYTYYVILLLFLTACQLFLIFTVYVQYKLHRVILLCHMVNLST
jgi:hypothetical protein